MDIFNRAGTKHEFALISKTVLRMTADPMKFSRFVMDFRRRIYEREFNKAAELSFIPAQDPNVQKNSYVFCM